MRELLAAPLCALTVAAGYASAWLGSKVPRRRSPRHPFIDLLLLFMGRPRRCR